MIARPRLRCCRVALRLEEVVELYHDASSARRDQCFDRRLTAFTRVCSTSNGRDI